MFEVNMREARGILEMAIDEKLSVLLLGNPGVGKTDLVETVTRTKHYGFLCFEGPSLDPTDARGVLIPDNGKSFFTRSALLPDPEAHGDKGVLLIDEISSALPSVQVALHPLFHPKERRLGTDKLPDGWIPMATGNYSTDGAGAHALLTAFADRCCIINVVEDLKVWKEDYAIPKGIHPITIGFLNFRPDLFSTFKKRNKGEHGKAFATPRAHTYASAVLYYADKVEMGETTILAALAGYLGDGVASEIMAFRKTYKELPDVMDIYGGKDIIPKDPSVLFALCSAMVARLANFKAGKNKKGMTLTKAIDRLLEFSLSLDAEFGGVMIRDAFISYSSELTSSKPWFQKVAKRYF